MRLSKPFSPPTVHCAVVVGGGMFVFESKTVGGESDIQSKTRSMTGKHVRIILVRMWEHISENRPWYDVVMTWWAA